MGILILLVTLHEPDIDRVGGFGEIEECGVLHRVGCWRLCGCFKNVSYLFDVFIAQYQNVVHFSHGHPGTSMLKTMIHMPLGGEKLLITKNECEICLIFFTFLQMADRFTKKNQPSIYSIHCEILLVAMSEEHQVAVEVQDIGSPKAKL